MKINTAQLVLIAGLSVAGATMSYAQATESELARYGYATSGKPERVVNLDNRAKYLNVTQLETVQLNFGGKSVTWTFDTLGTGSFPLSNVIPGAEGITVYVAKNPLYRGR
ncbi:MAG: CzcE family metal-binding protein [Burkholderiaceae bacterium]|nr:CzcE family metal-binding protein [Burkholderiaceae bacterium]